MASKRTGKREKEGREEGYESVSISVPFIWPSLSVYLLDSIHQTPVGFAGTMLVTDPLSLSLLRLSGSQIFSLFFSALARWASIIHQPDLREERSFNIFGYEIFIYVR